MKGESLVGIDVAARTLSVSGYRGKGVEVAEFENTAEGHKKLIRWAGKGGRRVRACLEATGVYHFELALALHRHPRVEVMVANPRATRHFAEAQMKRAKTDRVDRGVILDFLERMPFRPWTPPDQAVLELRAIARRVSALTDECSREKARRHSTSKVPSVGAVIENDIEVNIRHLDRRIELLRAKAIELVQSHETLNRRYEQLVSVKGIGEVSAIQILAEVTVLPDDMSSSQWVAHSGLDPVPKESGDRQKQRSISKRGNKYLRTALYMPALVAIKYCPNVRSFYEDLLSRGKEKLRGVIAVMRKLLVAIWGMFKNNQMFAPEKFRRLTA